MKLETIDKIKAHYEHAVEKHPKFVDRFLKGTYIGAKVNLNLCRMMLKEHIKAGLVDCNDILRCEIAEIHEAYKDGRLSDAKEECFDAIAVLLRMVDMIEKEESNDKH